MDGGGALASAALGVRQLRAVVGKHIGNILAKLDLPPDEDAHRRVLAVVTFLRG